MTNLTVKITAPGALVQAQVGVSSPVLNAMSGTGMFPPPPWLANLQIDTGASNTAIDLKIAEALKLLPTGQISLATPSSGQQWHYVPPTT